MQKLVLATVVAGLAASGSLSAATIYDEDGLTLDLKGDYQIQAYQPIGDDEDLDINYDDLALKFGATYDLGKDMEAFGQLNLDWKNQGDGSDDDIVDDAYVGVDYGVGTISAGNLNWGSDDFATEMAVEMDAGNAFPETGGNESIKLTFGAGPAEFIFSTDLSSDSNEDGVSDDSVYDLAVYGEFANVDAGLVYQSYKADDDADSFDTIGVRGEFEFNNIEIGADYSTNDEVSVTNVAAGFPIAAKTSAAVGAGFISPDSDDADDYTQWYANVEHKLHDKVTIFAEVGDNDQDGSDMGYLGGMKVKF